MTYKLSSDLCNVTSIPKLCLDNISMKAEDCICHIIQENLTSKQPISSIDIGIGVLYIKLNEDTISYKFIPSNRLENGIRTTIQTGENPLMLKLEHSLADRVKNTYKGLY